MSNIPYSYNSKLCTSYRSTDVRITSDIIVTAIKPYADPVRYVASSKVYQDMQVNFAAQSCSEFRRSDLV